MADIIKYNPNTGALLKPGEQVWDIQAGKLITQGQPVGSGTTYTAAQNAAVQSGSSAGASPIVTTPAPAPAATPASAVLTDAQITQYYATEGNKANPLSPTAWLAQQNSNDYSTVSTVAQANEKINAGQPADIAAADAAAGPQNKQSYTDLENSLAQILGSTAPTSSATTTLEQLKAAVTPTTPKPTEDLVGTYTQYRTQYGIDGLESQLNDLNTQLTAAQAAAQARQVAEGNKPGVATNVIQGRQSEAQIQDNQAITAIQSQIKTVNDQLTTKYNVVSTLMNLTEKDYQEAASDYDNQVSENISLFNTLNNINEQDKTDAQRIQDSARSSLQIVYNQLAANGTDTSSLPDSTKTLLTKLEVQAGLPAGFYETIKSKNPKADIVSTTTRVEANGAKYADIITQDSSTGKPNLQSVYLGQERIPADATTEDTTDADTQKALNDIIDYADTLIEGMKSIDPSKKITWSQAWTRMKQRYPNLTTEAVDNYLGYENREKYDK
jgi:hypothetical protein